MNIYGFLRETNEAAIKAGVDADTGLPRTGLEEYLRIIFPNTDDWIHDKSFGITNSGEISRKRPDYRSESLRIIVEFDGLQHYNNPDNIEKDIENTAFYESQGYKVVRIPYFIQLTRETINKMFGVDVGVDMFPNNIASLNYNNKNTPAYLCPSGIERMAMELMKYPEQLDVNIGKMQNDEKNGYKTGVKYLLNCIQSSNQTINNKINN